MQFSECHAVFPDRKRLSNHMRVHRRDDGDALTHPQKNLKVHIRYHHVLIQFYSFLIWLHFFILQQEHHTSFI
jgi:hypothetical protein